MQSSICSQSGSQSITLRVVEGLLSAHIEVGGLEIFRRESIAYAARLIAAGVGVEFHLYPGVPHVFDIFAPDIEITTRALENRLKAISSI
jgi:acetyl esterase/lipase